MLVERDWPQQREQRLPLLFQSDLEDHRREPVVMERLKRVEELAAARCIGVGVETSYIGRAAQLGKDVITICTSGKALEVGRELMRRIN